MLQLRNTTMLNSAHHVQATLVADTRDPEPGRGLTHGFYKYPARFSPSFAHVEALREEGII